MYKNTKFPKRLASKIYYSKIGTNDADVVFYVIIEEFNDSAFKGVEDCVRRT